MGKKLGCHFVGQREKTEKSHCSSAPSRPFDTAALLPEQRELSRYGSAFFRTASLWRPNAWRAIFAGTNGQVALFYP
jgi:hypothetical protein